MLAAARPSMRVHVELSTFAEQSTVRQIIEQIVRHADSLGLNEQELPTLRRHLANWHSTANKPSTLASNGVEDSTPSLAAMLDDARATFRLLRHITADEERHFSRLHMHTLAFQVSAQAEIWSMTYAAGCRCACVYFSGCVWGLMPLLSLPLSMIDVRVKTVHLIMVHNFYLHLRNITSYIVSL